MTDHECDKGLPYVVEREGRVIAKFEGRDDAYEYAEEGGGCKVIDTTPKPRVPEDAKFITWFDSSDERRVARFWGGESRKWAEIGSFIELRLEDLPGVTPDTMFTVLDERES